MSSNTIRLLCYGDLHLGPSDPRYDWEQPDLDTGEYDAVVCIGDVIDDNIDHADTVSAGQPYEERGRAFYEGLSGQGVPVLAVPGNHDPVDCTRRLTDGLEDVTVPHDQSVAGTAIGLEGFDDLTAVGWGCEQFDLSRRFPYGFDILNPVPDAEASTIHHESEQVAKQVLKLLSRVIGGTVTPADIGAELGVEAAERDAFEDEITDLVNEYEQLRSLLDASGGPTLCLSHESPFGTELDYHHSADSLRGHLHSGSIPLRLAIAKTAPLLTVSGHAHQQRRDAVETTSGHRDVYNPGSPGVVAIEIETEQQTVVIDEDPL